MARTPQVTDVQYLVLPDVTNPYLLAMVRWPDVAQAISVGRPEWQGDQGLFDLPYDPSSVRVTPVQAASIAARWGAHLPSERQDPPSSLIRRMPANWSNLVPAERYAWSLEAVGGWRSATSGAGHQRSFFRTRGRASSRGTFGETAEAFKLPDTIADGTAPGDGFYFATGGRRRETTVTGEHRHHARVRVHGRVQMNAGRQTIFANLVNVSQGGVHCIVPDAQPVLKLSGRLDPPLLLEDHVSKSQVSLDVVASVSWRSDTETGTQVGLVFGELNNEQAEQVQRFLVTVGSAARFLIMRVSPPNTEQQPSPSLGGPVDPSEHGSVSSFVGVDDGPSVMPTRAFRSRRGTDYRLRGLDMTRPGTAAEPESPANRARPSRRKHRRFLAKWVVVLIVATVAAVFLRESVFQPFSVPSVSMLPTLQVGDRILVVKSSALEGPVRVGDIVVFRHPRLLACSTGPGQAGDLVQRVIGLPGDTIWSHGNRIYVDGRLLRERGWYDTSYGQVGSAPILRTKIRPGEYFVMGDNRSDACDSRAFGTIARSAIVGKVFAIVVRDGHAFIHLF